MSHEAKYRRCRFDNLFYYSSCGLSVMRAGRERGEDGGGGLAVKDEEKESEGAGRVLQIFFFFFFFLSKSAVRYIT
jgi:hypothetical protein